MGATCRKLSPASGLLQEWLRQIAVMSYPDQGAFDTGSGFRWCQDVSMAADPKRGYRALRKGRWSQANGIYLLTTVTDRRIPWFQVFEFGRIVSKRLHHSACLGDAVALCWVVMPDHIHILLQLGELPLPRVMNRFKSTTAIRLNRAIGRTGRFWQAGYHDRALRRDEDLRDVARYVVANPLRAGLVRKLADHPFWNAVWL